jgi:hypothetical protein
VATGDEFVDILTDIETSGISKLENELEAWAGMKFRVVSTMSPKQSDISNIQNNGDKILPIKL